MAYKNTLTRTCAMRWLFVVACGKLSRCAWKYPFTCREQCQQTRNVKENTPAHELRFVGNSSVCLKRRPNGNRILTNTLLKTNT